MGAYIPTSGSMSLGVTTWRLAPESEIHGAILLVIPTSPMPSALDDPRTASRGTTRGPPALHGASSSPLPGGLGSKMWTQP
eukprot:570688-Alexandrium_andersonii.AAC.1